MTPKTIGTIAHLAILAIGSQVATHSSDIHSSYTLGVTFGTVGVLVLFAIRKCGEQS